jgi:hypothetical protein
MMEFKQVIDILASGGSVRRKTWYYDMSITVNVHNILVTKAAHSPATTVYRPDWQDLIATDWERVHVQ